MFGICRFQFKHCLGIGGIYRRHKKAFYTRLQCSLHHAVPVFLKSFAVQMRMGIGNYHGAKITVYTLYLLKLLMMMSLKKFLAEKGYVKIPLTLTKTNHFELAAEINGVAGRFILDTGASSTCVGVDFIDHFKLTAEATEVKASGAGATHMETQIAKKNHINIYNWKKKRVVIILFNLIHVNEALTEHEALPVHGIIGADILKKGKAVIDYDKKLLFLK